LARPQHVLGVVDVDVAHEREAEEAHRLLAMHEEDHPRAALLLDAREQPAARALEQPLTDHGLERRDDEKQPQEIAGSHRLASCYGPAARRGSPRTTGAAKLRAAAPGRNPRPAQHARPALG